MTESKQRIEAARKAESNLWKQYDLSVKEQFIDIPTPPLQVRILEFGNPTGVPLVFVQGGLGEAIGWYSLIAHLSDDFRCITLDRPGGGLSDGIDFLKVDVRKLAVDVLQAVLDAANLDQAVFVANSMGAWWTFQLALQAPDRVSRMILPGCPALILDTSAPFPMRLMSLPLLGRLLVKLMSPANSEKARELPIFLGHPKEVGQRWSDIEAETWYHFGKLPDFQRSWYTLLRRFLNLRGGNREMQITAEDLQKISQPTLFLWGKDDPFGSTDSGRTAAELISDAHIEVVGTGHLPWWDEPDKCARLIRAFVSNADK